MIRPVHPADLPALAHFFEDLSVESRYLRFFAPVRPTGSLLRRLSGGTADVDALVAVADGVIVGHAMATDRAEDPTFEDPFGARVADIGVVVADAWQRQGVGAALMRALVTRAQARGVTSLAMDVLPDNRAVLAMIISHWPEAVVRHSPDSLDIRVPLPRLQLPQPEARALVRPLVTLGAVALIGRVGAGDHRRAIGWSRVLRILTLGRLPEPHRPSADSPTVGTSGAHVTG